MASLYSRHSLSNIQGISAIGSISPMALSLIRNKLCAYSVDGSALSGALSLVSKLLVFVYIYCHHMGALLVSG